MWLVFAFLSALFAGITSVLAKIGIQKTDSTVATAFRTVVVLIFSWLMVFLVGSQNMILELDGRSLLFLILSGAATGASWLCYFKALAVGDVNKVVSVDKSSVVLSVLFSIILFGETEHLVVKFFGILTIAIGTYLMIEKKRTENTREGQMWFFFAIGSAVFASLQTVLAKAGVDHVESNLATAIRTIVVLIMAWFMILATGKKEKVRCVPKKEFLFICLSGVATGASWLCYYRALATGPASVVISVDKLSILFSVAATYLILKEKLTKKSLIGLLLIVVGTLAMAIFATK